MSNRRSFLQFVGSLPLLGSLGCSVAKGPKRDYLKELGVRPIINAAGHYTMFTGSLMWPETVEAIEALSHHYVRIEELHDAVGRRIAEMLGAESAMVPSGCFAALALGTAACITGSNPDFILRFPSDMTGMKNEVIIQKAHRFPYDHAIRNLSKLIEVETREQLEKAINPKTAMLMFLNKADPDGKVKMAEFIEIAKKHNIPTMNDAAADVPPIERLTQYIKMGFDLVACSGGKGIRGPQSAGLLLGRKDLIKAARLNTVPISDTFGRGYKVNKEELVGMMVAVETYLKVDHKAEWEEWETRIKTISGTLASVKGVTTERFLPTIANETPHVRISWDPAVIKLTAEQAQGKLREGEPSIECVPGSYKKGTLEVAAWTLLPGEAETVARRIKEVLTQT